LALSYSNWISGPTSHWTADRAPSPRGVTIGN
jgi:hypothetical protein